MQVFPMKIYKGTVLVATLLILIILSTQFAREQSTHRHMISSFSDSTETKQRVIPKILHVVVGQTDQKGVPQRFASTAPFSFFNYLVLLAGRLQIQPTTLFVHYYEEPNTFWWNMSKKDPEIRMTLVKSRHVEQIFSKPITHHSHRSDILRLEVLLQYGGIYMDSDVLAFRSFDPLLNLSDVVLANQDDHKHRICGAVVLAKKNAVFLKRWYDAYQSYDGTCWDCHAVTLPGTLALAYSSEVRVLPTETFFRPSWTESKQFFEENTYNFTSNYASHLWNKINRGATDALTPSSALKLNNTFGRMVRRAVGEERLRKLDELLSKRQ